MRYLLDSLNVAAGLLLMAVTAYAALQTLLKQVVPEIVIVGGNGDIGALLTMALFALGAFVAANGLFTGLDDARSAD